MHCTVSDTVFICISLMATVLIFLGEGGVTVGKNLTSNSKEETFVLGHDFLKLQPMVPGLHVLGQHTTAGGDSPPHEARKQERGRKELGKHNSLKHPGDSVLRTRYPLPQLYHFLII